MYELMNSWRGFRQFLIFKILGGDFFNIFSVGWNHLRSVKVFHYITTLPSNNCLYHAIPTYLALDPSFQRVSSFAQNRLVSFRTPTCAIDCHGLKLPQTVARRRCYPLNVSHPNRLIQQGPPHLPHFFLGGGCWRYLNWQMTGGAIPPFSAGGLSPHRRAAEKTFQKGLKQVGEFVPKGDIWHFRMVMHWHLIISKWNYMQMYDEHRQN